MAAMGKGYFITFEGGEGAGKSTQLRALAKSLQKQVSELVVTREPGGSPAAERIRTVLLDAALSLDAMTELMLFSAARRDHWLKTIQPALQRGALVLCDRFFDSTFAYQGAAGGVSQADMGTLTDLALNGARPDLTIILDIAPDTGLARAAIRRGTDSADSFEAKDIRFHQKIRQALLDIAAAEPKRCLVFDATLEERAITEAIFDAVQARLGAY
jgi:dTMP kinase